MSGVVKVKGIPVELGGRALVVPPLNFRALQQLEARLASFTGGADKASMDLVLDVAEAALARNYDDVSRDFLLEHLDIGNMQEFMEAAMDVSGLKRKALDQQLQGGAAGQPGPSTGATSTHT